MYRTINKHITAKLFLPLVALATITGLTVHDTKLDALTVIAIAIPVTIASYEGAHMLLHASEAHTHVERISVGEAASKSTSLAPWLTRNGDDRYRRHRANRSGQPFEDYHLPATA